MMLRYSFIVVIISLALLAVLPSCKTSEANYRQAYERAVAGRDSINDIESNIYGATRREMDMRTIILPDSTTVEVYTQRVVPTIDSNTPQQQLNRYNVVVGRFKQIFNARSLRNRLAEGAYPAAMIVENSEPYYFVVIGSYTTLPDAVAAMRAIPEGSIAMRTPLPFILDAPSQRRLQ